MDPTISAILTVYNRFELTKRAVESVLSQTLPVSEIILVDDGSFDGTSELLLQYMASSPGWRERVRYFHQDNQGPGAARNKGITEAKGEWVAFIDNDDLWLPQKLEWQFRALEHFSYKCSACITDAWFMNNPHMKMTLFQLADKRHGEGMGIIDDPLGYMLQRGSRMGIHPVWLQNLVVRTDLARRAGGFDPDLPWGDDDDFVFRLGCETPFCFVNIPMVLIDRTPLADRHIGASRRWDDEEFRLRMTQIRYEKRLAMSDKLPQSIRNRIRKDLVAVHSGWANVFLHNGNYDKARRSADEAASIQLRPNIAVKWLLIHWTPTLARKLALMRDEHRCRRTVGMG
jgi:glycosyltransferase involved in cell wall biosynthesis